MLGLPILGLKWVAGAVVGQAGVLRRVSGRGMGLHGAGVCLGVAPYFLVSYFPLASLILFCQKGAPRFCAVGAKLLHVAVLSSELCCRTSSGARQSLRAAASITDFLAKPAQQAQQTDEVGPWPPAAEREKRAASAATAAAAGAASDWRWWRSGRSFPPSS